MHQFFKETFKDILVSATLVVQVDRLRTFFSLAFQHWNSSDTLAAIHNGQDWDVAILQEFSTRLAQDQYHVCRQSYPYVQNLVNGEGLF